MYSRSQVKAEEWLKYVNQPFVPGMMLQSFMGTQTMAPADAFGVGDYVERAAAAAGSGSAPQSVFEGMQTVADLARTHANYNPIDVEGTGNKAHLLQFTQNIADAPFLSLLESSTVDIYQKSHNANQLINSFVDAFVGIAEKDKETVKSAVQNLANAALSYSGQAQRLSNFVQNLLQTNSSGDVQFHLYSSVFLIVSEKNKGIITFESSYSLARAVYQLSQASWNEVLPIFSEQKKTSTENWLEKMKTPIKSNGAKALCLS